MSHKRPPLSVVIATTDAGKTLADAIGAVSQQTLAVGGEILIVTGVPLPEEIDLAGIEIVEVPKANIFELRAVGANAACGEIVAFIEDHVIVGEHWTQSTLSAHARHPEAAVVGGPVDNGSRKLLMDWANFVMTFGPFLPPITAQRYERLPVIANLSLKRAALPETPMRAGELELMLVPKLVAEKRSAYDDEPLVWHVQSHGRLGTLRAHFHNARATAGMMIGAEPWSQRRWRGCVRRLGRLAETAIDTMKEKPMPRRARRSLPLVLLLCATHVAGGWWGAAFGVGRSPERLS